ncbi:hypothetical protein QBC43DRAFT_244120 [Cladorrhinum sp. PSN259]|nr:hypothetical protein QBC43DRAFT_244120 [Cladorrhinum sp. PSN259]
MQTIFQAPFPFRRPTETIAHFLARLPPSAASLTYSPQFRPVWYCIHNPHSATNVEKTPAELEPFMREGKALLSRFRFKMAPLSKYAHGDRQLKAELRSELQQNIVDLAKSHDVKAGKWMLLPPLPSVDETWSKVCHAVDSDLLGPQAKVSTSGITPKDPLRLICVYTSDFTDLQDVKRVLFRLRDLGLVNKDMWRGIPIAYKCDAYTHLSIYSKNIYGINPSVYRSRDFLEKKKEEEEEEDAEMGGI